MHWSRKWRATLLLSLAALMSVTDAVKHQDFKTCDQSGFCKRNRGYADKAASVGSAWTSPYVIDAKSITFRKGHLDAIVLKTSTKDDQIIRLPLSIAFLKSGVARVTLDEERRQKGEIELRHNSQARKERYNEAGLWALAGGLDVAEDASIKDGEGNGVTTVQYGPDKSYEAVITHQPFGIDFKRDGETQVKFNDRGYLNVEHWRPKVEKKEGETEKENSEDESTWWDESFGGNVDSKPRGPESVALDITFPNFQHVFGIPEHTGPLALKETRGASGQYSEPYRMFNSDVFEYILDSPMTMYGAIPFMQAHRKGSTAGVFWLNAAETWVDIVKTKSSANPLSLGIGSKTSTQTHWISETGLLDVFILMGSTPKDIIKKYGELTGYSTLPPSFSIGYHQCRWNYFTDQDVRDVDRRFDRYNIPYDVIWLDLEYTDEKKYFTWDPLNFKDPIGMQQQLAEHDRKLVIIIDPHIKNTANYPIVEELKSKGLAVRNKEGNIYEGWCWPGSSHWVDCFNPAAIEWWKGLFKYDHFKGTSSNVFLWNDMNEPSVFNGPEISFPRDNLHFGNWENRDVHNLNGMTFHNATYQALIERGGGKKGDNKKQQQQRPFVLTRSFFAGSQRLSAMWTGDNQARWDHLAASIPMIISLGISGYPNAGADIGGFFGNPDKELLTRWYQTGIFYPFMRAHAHIDTRRREPYLVEEPHRGYITQAIRLRYQLLPAWYTAFHEASQDGSPILRPMFYMFPGDEEGFDVDDQFFVGSTGLLAKPVTGEGVSSVDIHLANDDEEVYYDYFDFTKYNTGGGSGGSTGGILSSKKRTLKVPATIDTIPLLMRGGNIIPRRDRVRRSSGLMKFDPFTLVVVLNKTGGEAEGTVYLDDGESFEYRDGGYIHRRFVFTTKEGGGMWTLKSTDIGTSSMTTSKDRVRKEFEKSMKDVRIEKVVIVGAPSSWKGIKEVVVKTLDRSGKEKETTKKVELSYVEPEGNDKDKKANWAVVRDPNVGIGEDWLIDFSS